MSDKFFNAGSPSRLEKSLYYYLEKVAVVLFLIDGSGSVPDDGFKTMVNTVRSIANRIKVSPERLISAFQYATKVTPSCTPTSNVTQFHQALDNMVQDKAGNEEALALDMVVKTLRDCPVPGQRLIIHLTDGGLMGRWKEAATNVKINEKIVIMSIGVGERIDAHNIREFASPELAFFVKNYNELQQMFQFLDLAPLVPPVLKPVHEKKVDARAIHLDMEVYPVADVKYHVEILDPSTLKWKLATSSIHPNIIVKDNIRPSTTYTLRVFVELENGRATLPSKEVTVTTLPANPFSLTRDLVAEVDARLKGCREFIFSAPTSAGLDQVNGLIAGVPGAGKSSILSAVLSMLLGRYQPCGANGDINVTLTRVVTEIEGLVKLVLIDTPGLTDDNRKHYEKHLYFGGVTPGFDERNPDYTLLKTVSQLDIGQQVHCVILAVSVETLVDLTIMAMLKEQYHTILTQGRNCIVLLTKVDKADPRIKMNDPDTLALVYESGIVMNFRKSLATNLGMSVDCVLPVVSYNTSMKPIPWVSMLHLDWIEKALTLSDGFCATYVAEQKSLLKSKEPNLTKAEVMDRIFNKKASTAAPTTTTTESPTPTTYMAPSPMPVVDENSSECEILIRREEDPAEEWSSIYLRNSDRTILALKNAICERYSPRTPASIVKLVEERKIGAGSINKKIETHQDVHHLINSAMKGNMVFVVVSFIALTKI